MKSFTDFILEASKPIKEFEDELKIKFPSKTKVEDGVLSFELQEKKYIDYSSGWFYKVFLKKYNNSNNNYQSETIKDESDLSWDFGNDSPNGDEKWIRIYTITSDSGQIYKMIETQVRTYGKKHDVYYVSIKKD